MVEGFQTLIIQWALNRGSCNDWTAYDQRSNSNHFIYRCLVSRRNHPEVNHPIIKLFCEVANLGRLKRRHVERSKESLLLFELFQIVLPKYYKQGERHLYLELIEDTLSSHLFQFEKERADKQFLLFKSVDNCFCYLYSFTANSKDPQNDCHSTLQTKAYQQNLSILCSIWQNNPHMFKYTVSQFLNSFTKLIKSE